MSLSHVKLNSFLDTLMTGLWERLYLRLDGM